MIKRPAVFYGWVIVAIAAVTMIPVYGSRHSFSVFFPSILDEFGWSRAGTAGMYSLNILVYGMVAPIAGGFGARWDPKRVMVLGAVLLGLSTAANALATELWHFYVIFGLIMPLGTAFAGWPLLAGAVVNWFSKRRGLVIGLSQMGGGLSFAFGLFAEWVITELGWRWAYVVLGGIVVAVLLPLHVLFFHYRPEGKGLRPYGADAADGAGGPAPTDTPRDWSLRQALATRHLWLLVSSYFLYWGIGCYLVLAHQVKFAEDVGYSGVFAASIFALFGVCMFLGQSSGFLSDSLGRERTITFAVALAIGALVALLSVKDTSQPWLLYAYAVAFGYGTGLYSSTMGASTADIFHGRQFGGVIGLLLAGMGVGGAIGPWLGGYIYDVTGGYVPAFILCIACFALSCVSVWVAAPRNAAAVRSARLNYA